MLSQESSPSPSPEAFKSSVHPVKFQVARRQKTRSLGLKIRHETRLIRSEYYRPRAERSRGSP